MFVGKLQAGRQAGWPAGRQVAVNKWQASVVGEVAVALCRARCKPQKRADGCGQVEFWAKIMVSL